MELSIVIVNYKTKKLTEQCVDSVYTSKPKVSYEIIIVDNSGEMPKSPRYTLITNGQNVGFAKANNQGIRQAKAKYILLLNSDTKVTKGAIDTLYAFAKEHADAGYIAAHLLNEDMSTQPSVFRFPTFSRYLQHYWLGKRSLLSKYAPENKEPIEVDVAVAAAALITPQTLQKVGLLDERYFMYFEDFDLCRRVWAAGLKVYYVPDAKIVHLHGASGRHVAGADSQWKRMIPSAKIYYGMVGYHLRWFISRSSQLLGITR